MSHLRIIPVEFGYAGCFMAIPAALILLALHAGTSRNLTRCFQPINIMLWGTVLTAALWCARPPALACAPLHCRACTDRVVLDRVLSTRQRSRFGSSRPSLQ